jgi:MYXO-CTERM domain-containing protein
MKMKLKKIILSTAFVVAGTALFQTAAKAQSATAGDLILGFQTTGTGSATNLETDLGAYTGFEGLAPGTVINLTTGSNTAGYGAFSLSDLTATYGATPASLFFGAAADNQVLNNDVVLTDASTPTEHVNQSTAFNNITNMPNAFDNGTQGAVGSTDSLVAAPFTTGNGTYEGTALVAGTYNNGFSNTQAQFSSSGTETLNVYDIPESDDSHAITDLGYLTLTSAGTLTFTAAPEPSTSTYALFGLGALAMVLAIRRRRADQV